MSRNCTWCTEKSFWLLQPWFSRPALVPFMILKILDSCNQLDTSLAAMLISHKFTALNSDTSPAALLKLHWPQNTRIIVATSINNFFHYLSCNTYGTITWLLMLIHCSETAGKSVIHNVHLTALKSLLWQTYSLSCWRHECGKSAAGEHKEQRDKVKRNKHEQRWTCWQQHVFSGWLLWFSTLSVYVLGYIYTHIECPIIHSDISRYLSTSIWKPI